jgi:hypothetical protein
MVPTSLQCDLAKEKAISQKKPRKSLFIPIIFAGVLLYRHSLFRMSARLFSYISLPYFDVGSTPTYKHPSCTSYFGSSVLGENFPTAVLEFLNNLWGLQTE